MTISVPNSAGPGSQISVSVASSSRAGETVIVKVKDGEGAEQEVPVTLNAAGQGSSPWSVPLDWDTAIFEDGVCDSVQMVIT